MTKSSIKTDLFVIGGGPAGLVTAIAARRKGLTAAVADCAIPPLDKACGEGLMPDAIASLIRLGVSMPSSAGYPFAGIRFTDGQRSVESPFPTGFGLGIRRTVLHDILAKHAADSGVSMFWGARVDRAASGEIVMGDTPVRARWIIGADGHKSRVRRWAGLHEQRRQQSRFGFRMHFRAAPWTNCVEVHWGPGSQVVVTPVSADEVCVVVMSRNPKLRLDEALQQFPEINRRLNGVQSTSIERGALTAMMSLDQVYNGAYALVGDASGSVDAITGEGLCLAFQQAERLANALAANDLRLYQRAHRRVVRLPMFMSRLLLSMDRSELLRRAVFRIFESRPRIFSKLLAIHVGSLRSDREQQAFLPAPLELEPEPAFQKGVL